MTCLNVKFLTLFGISKKNADNPDFFLTVWQYFGHSQQFLTGWNGQPEQRKVNIHCWTFLSGLVQGWSTKQQHRKRKWSPERKENSTRKAKHKANLTIATRCFYLFLAYISFYPLFYLDFSLKVFKLLCVIRVSTQKLTPISWLILDVF